MISVKHQFDFKTPAFDFKDISSTDNFANPSSVSEKVNKTQLPQYLLQCAFLISMRRGINVMHKL